MSILKTIYLIFGLGPNNMFDAVATDLRDMFTLDKDLTGYQSVDTDHRVFDAKKAYDPADPRFKDRKWAKSPTKMDDPAFVEKLRRTGGGGGTR